MAKTQDLTRFVTAQQRDYATALSEIKNGRKRSHWMWYVFPQILRHGLSETSSFYAIKGRMEAEAYRKHPVLGPRLTEISKAMMELESNDAHAILGSPDDMKLQSCMTLFALLLGADPVFNRVLTKFFNGKQDTETIRLLQETT